MVSERQHYNQATGEKGENLVFEILQGLDFDPEWGGSADIEVEGMSVEVKTSNLTAYRADGRLGYQFCLHRDGHCKIQADILILVCVTPSGNDFFIIPANMVGKRRKIAIPQTDLRKYHGRWSWYLHRWDILEAMRWTRAQEGG